MNIIISFCFLYYLLKKLFVYIICLLIILEVGISVIGIKRFFKALYIYQKDIVFYKIIESNIENSRREDEPQVPRERS